MFIVGVAMPYSYAARHARGDSKAKTAGHVLYRALVLILLGIFLRSNGREHTNFTFEDMDAGLRRRGQIDRNGCTSTHVRR